MKHQKFGGPDFNASRMTWIKPSFAWVLYRSGYGHKHNQNRILKLKLSHDAMALILEQCECKHGGGGSYGRVQWDPARDLFSAEGHEPRKMLRTRAIQIGVKGRLSELYVASVLSIEDVTELAHQVYRAHQALQSQTQMRSARRQPQTQIVDHSVIDQKQHKVTDDDGSCSYSSASCTSSSSSPMVESLSLALPKERDYLPRCSTETLIRLGMLPGPTADAVCGLGRGKVPTMAGSR